LGQKTTFATCYSPADFIFSYGLFGLEISTATAKSGWGLGFVYIISALSKYFPIETTITSASKGGKPDRKQQFQVHRKEENLTENHITPIL
jgi:hypothetical protein